jgi:mono/diheme cytochrome c family protein
MKTLTKKSNIANQWLVYPLALGFIAATSGCFDSSSEQPPPPVETIPAAKPGPSVVDDTLSIPPDTQGIVDVLSNDSGTGPLSIASVDTTGSNGGAILNNGDGTFTYTPPPGFEGEDTFSYSVKVSGGGSSKGMVTVTISSSVIPNGQAYYASNCAICHAAGPDDTSTAFNSSDLALRLNPLKRDLSLYGGEYQLMGAFDYIAQKNIDELKAYVAVLTP